LKTATRTLDVSALNFDELLAIQTTTTCQIVMFTVTDELLRRIWAAEVG
jgi:hypothetical protein